MQSTQNGLGLNLVIDRNVVPAGFDLLVAGPRSRNSRSEAGMWSSLIVMGDPLLQDSPYVSLVQRNQEVQTFPADRTHESFTESIRLRCPKRSFQDSHAQ